MIILIAYMFNRRKETLVMVHRQWVLMSHDRRRVYVPRPQDKEKRMCYLRRIGKHPFPSIDNILYVKGLKYNLLSISQLCDGEYDVSFNKGECIIKDFKDLTKQNVTCLVSINDDHTWHKNLGHACLRLIFKLKKHNFVRGLPNFVHKVDLLCDACQKGKQIRGSFESKNFISTFRPLELLYIDLFGPTKTTSLSEKHYE
ncbi:hypothetical protein CR513_20517, partial [Mucuna pruriens]